MHVIDRRASAGRAVYARKLLFTKENMIYIHANTTTPSCGRACARESAGECVCVCLCVCLCVGVV
jgi:hypothetical protein